MPPYRTPGKIPEPVKVKVFLTKEELFACVEYALTEEPTLLSLSAEYEMPRAENVEISVGVTTTRNAYNNGYTHEINPDEALILEWSTKDI